MCIGDNVATAFGVRLEELKGGGLIGGVSLLLGLTVSFAFGGAVAYAWGYRDAASITKNGAGAAPLNGGPGAGTAGARALIALQHHGSRAAASASSLSHLTAGSDGSRPHGTGPRVTRGAGSTPHRPRQLPLTQPFPPPQPPLLGVTNVSIGENRVAQPIRRERDLHFAVVAWMRRRFPGAAAIPGLGESKDTPDERIASKFKGYVAGQAGLAIP